MPRKSLMAIPESVPVLESSPKLRFDGADAAH